MTQNRLPDCDDCSWHGPELPTFYAAATEMHRALHVFTTTAWESIKPAFELIARAMEQVSEQRRALIRHGYDPDLAPRGVAGPPGEVTEGWEDCERVLLRNRVCELDGIEIDGHETSDLDTSSTCIHCGEEVMA